MNRYIMIMTDDTEYRTTTTDYLTPSPPSGYTILGIEIYWNTYLHHKIYNSIQGAT